MNDLPLGKRGKQKQATRAALLTQARQMFRARGYDATRIEDIAAAAGIAVGTCYNYFERKADMLIAIVIESDRDAISEAESIFDALPDDPEQALAAVALHDSNSSLDALEKPLWRQVLASTLDAPDSTFARAYVETTNELRSLMTRCVLELQRRGTIRADLDAVTVSHTVFAAKYMLFVEHISDDRAPRDRHEQEICAMIATIVNGLRPIDAGPMPVDQPKSERLQ